MSETIRARAVRRILLVLLIGVGADLLTSPASAAPPQRDPLEGKWLGMAGTEREKVEVGLQFQRDASGKLGLKITQPISNYFDADAGGEPRRDGDRVVHEGLALSLQLDGDTLRGTYPGPNSPATLRRVDLLPEERAPPKVPTGPAPRWQVRIGGQVYASPIVADAVAYIGTTGGVFNAVDTRDGRIVWTFSAGRPIFGSAVVTADAVYFVCDNGYLYNLDRSTGKERWRYTLGDAEVARVLPHAQVYDWDWQGAQPLVVDDRVFVGSGDGGMHAVDVASGARRWRFDTRGKIRNGAAVAGDRIVFGSADHHLYALDRATGKESWRYDTGAEIDATPVVYEDRVLIGNRGSGLLSLALDSGELKWRLFFWGSWVESTPVVSDGVIYVGSSDLRRVSAVNPADGRVIWRSDVYGWTWGTPLVVDDRLYVGVAGGTPYFVRHVASFTAVERKTGRILTRWPLPDTGGHQWGIAGSPARAGDTVVVATIAGSLFGFPLR